MAAAVVEVAVAAVVRENAETSRAPGGGAKIFSPRNEPSLTLRFLLHHHAIETHPGGRIVGVDDGGR